MQFQGKLLQYNSFSESAAIVLEERIERFEEPEEQGTYYCTVSPKNGKSYIYGASHT